MKPIKAYKTYQGSLDAERHREKQWRSTRQGAFESSFVSFEETKEGYYPLSATVRRSREADQAKLRQAYMNAYMRVKRKLPHCLEVFKLIIKNGKKRKKSIWELVHQAQARKIKPHKPNRKTRKPNRTISKRTKKL